MKDSFVFFGTPEPAVIVLDQLAKANLFPTHIVTNPDRPAGRGLELQPSPAKAWGEKNNIPVLTPEKLDSDFEQELKDINPNLCVIVAYGKILNNNILNIPKKGFMNVHPSLLPLHRGATPIQSAILAGDAETGATVMQIDEKMDHGPIIAQELIELTNTETGPELHQKLFEIGGQILAETLPEWLAGNIDPQEQDHKLASYTKKIEKKNGELLESDSDETKWLKYRAYFGWPGVFYFENNKVNGKAREDGLGHKRVKVTQASFKDEKFQIEKIIPEGKKEQTFLK
jgi:methionyl-tRNA formyltransferase